MAASRTVNSSWRICRRYKLFFYVCLVVLLIQLYLGYSFYHIQRDVKAGGNGEHDKSEKAPYEKNIVHQTTIKLPLNFRRKDQVCHTSFQIFINV